VRVGLGRGALLDPHAAVAGDQRVVLRGLGVAPDRELDHALDARVHQPRRRPEDGADVDPFALARRAPGVAVAPPRELPDDRHQPLRALGQLVVDARGHLAVALPREQAVGHHAVEPRAQLLGRDARQCALDLDEATRPGRKIAHDQERPLVTDEIEGAAVRGPLVVRMALGRRDARNDDHLRAAEGSGRGQTIL
jgi:hypothetical protein